MTRQQEMVREFHRRFGLTVNDHPTWPSEADRALRLALIKEEFEELVDAVVIVNVADALGDLKYVTLGAAVCYGLELNHDTSLRENPFLANGIELFEKATTVDQARHALEIIDSSVECMANQYRIDLDAVFEEIHRSNLSKMFTTKECRNMAVNHPDWQCVLAGSVKEDRRWVVYNEIQKVMKSPSYSPADIESVLNMKAV